MFKRLFCVFFLCLWTNSFALQPISSQTLLAQRLHPGDTVALIASAFRVQRDADIVQAKRRLQQLGLHVVLGRAVYARDGYFAGTDAQRAADLNWAFSDPKIKAIFELRGGWGSNRILPLLDYKMMRANPKILIGFSDITSLLLAIHRKTGLVTFHGPLAVEDWPDVTVSYLKQVLFEGRRVDFTPPDTRLSNLFEPIQVIYPGTVKGKLIGGNLSVLVSLIGTPYEPDWKNTILFVEDVGEQNYQIDRMMSQLQLSGVLSQIKGFVFGTCVRCQVVRNTTNTKTLKQVLSHYLVPHHIPSFMGAMIGHQMRMFTLPIGVMAQLDAKHGTIKMLAPAVQ